MIIGIDIWGGLTHAQLIIAVTKRGGDIVLIGYHSFNGRALNDKGITELSACDKCIIYF